MDLDVLEVQENKISEEKEEFIKEEVKEEIKESGTKSIGISCSPADFKSTMLNYFDGGKDISVVLEQETNSTTSNIYLKFIDKYNTQYRVSVYGFSNTLTGNTKVVNGRSYNEYIINVADSECIGLNYYYSSGSNYFIETYPIVGQSIDNPTVSGNSIDYTEYLETIIERLEGIEENVQIISNNVISAGNGSNNNNNGQVGSVSQNILTTPINEYGLTDSLLVVGLSVGFIVLMIVVVRRLVYKWS